MRIVQRALKSPRITWPDIPWDLGPLSIIGFHKAIAMTALILKTRGKRLPAIYQFLIYPTFSDRQLKHSNKMEVFESSIPIMIQHYIFSIDNLDTLLLEHALW